MKKFKEFIEKVKANPLWIFLLSSAQLWNILKLLYTIMKSIVENIKMEDHKTIINLLANFDWFNFVTQTIIVVVLYFVLRKYNTIKEEQTIFSYISHIRNKRRFVESYSDTQFFRLPNETEEDLKKRLPEYGLFQDELIDEYEYVKASLQNGFMKNKGTSEIDEILSKWYPFLRKAK